MTIVENIKGKPVYAGGNTSVNIRENVTTASAIIGNIAAGGAIGTATGSRFPDLNHGTRQWYEITLPGGLLGYVREDLALFTTPSKLPDTTAGASRSLKTAFHTQSTLLPKWTIAAIALCFLLTGISVYFLVKTRKSHK
jgi:hypothetical protein